MRNVPWLLTVYTLLMTLIILPKDMVKSLQCYTCIFNSRNETAGCQHLDTSLIKPTLCSSKHKFCKVERMIVHSKLAKFYRGCEETCTPECKVVPDHEKCVSCCQDDLCNTGSSAHPLHPGHAENYVIISLLSVTMFAGYVPSADYF